MARGPCLPGLLSEESIDAEGSNASQATSLEEEAKDEPCSVNGLSGLESPPLARKG